MASCALCLASVLLRSSLLLCCCLLLFMLTNASTDRRAFDVPATLLPQDECEGCRRKSPPGDRSGSQAGVRCRGMSPWGFDDGCSAQVGYLLYGDLQTERRYVWPRHKKCAVPMCRFDSFGSLSSALDQEGLHSYPLHLKSFSCMTHAMCCIFVVGLH